MLSPSARKTLRNARRFGGLPINVKPLRGASGDVIGWVASGDGVSSVARAGEYEVRIGATRSDALRRVRRTAKYAYPLPPQGNVYAWMRHIEGLLSEGWTPDTTWGDVVAAYWDRRTDSSPPLHFDDRKLPPTGDVRLFLHFLQYNCQK
jgi:hypothetical protein